MITIEQLNQWQDIIRSYNNQPIPMEELIEKCNDAGLAEVNSYLIANNYIARMKDGNTWINWSKNRFYEDATIINLKAQVLIKRGPGNRGPMECGTTHEATSGMSS